MYKLKKITVFKRIKFFLKECSLLFQRDDERIKDISVTSFFKIKTRTSDTS